MALYGGTATHDGNGVVTLSLDSVAYELGEAIASAQICLYRTVDVEGVWRYYKLQASTLATPSVPTTNPPTGWTDTEPTYTSGSTNSLYFTDLTLLSDGTWSYSPVSLSSSYEAAKQAYNKAVAAAKTATDYINFSTEDGLVVGDMNEDTLGNNVRIKSNSVDIRNSSTVFASFAAKLLELGKNAVDAVIEFCDGQAKLSVETQEGYSGDVTTATLSGENTTLFGSKTSSVFARYIRGLTASGVEAGKGDTAVTMQTYRAGVDVDANADIVGRHQAQVRIWASDVMKRLADTGLNQYASSEFDLTPTEIYGLTDYLRLTSRYDTTFDVVGGQLKLDATDLTFNSVNHIETSMPIRQHFRCCSCSTALTLGTSAKKVTLGTTQNYSTTLTEASGGGIKCTKAGAVMVSGTVYATGMTAGNALIAQIYKGTSELPLASAQTGTKQYVACHVSTRTILVNAGDVIYLYAYNMNAATGTVNADARTQLTVTYVS